MKSHLSLASYAIPAAFALSLVACTGLPTLVGVARERHGHNKDDVTADYTITDRDVVNYADQVNVRLCRHFSQSSALAYSSSTTQFTLTALSASAKTFGWTVGTASSLGAGATIAGGISQIFDSKGDAALYEAAYIDIQSAESNYLFCQTGGKFITDPVTGKTIADASGCRPMAGIPSETNLTVDGSRLKWRIGKILKVLDDALAKKVPDLQTLKDAKGDTSNTSLLTPPSQTPGNRGTGSTVGSGETKPKPKKPKTPPPVVNPPVVPPSTPAPPPAPRPDDTAALQRFWMPDGVNVDPANDAKFKEYLKNNGVAAAVYEFLAQKGPKLDIDRAKARKALIGD